MKKKINKGFSLLELIVTVALILLLAIVVLLNPFQQIKKAWDSQRKHDFSILQKTFDDYYNDKQSYPIASSVCYDGITPDPVNPDTIAYCNLCGRNANSPSFPYLSRLPCDPQYSQKNYRYQFDNSNSGNQPQWYRLCTVLSTENAVNGQYNYAVTSPNQNPDPILCSTTPSSPSACPADPENKYCFKGLDNQGNPACNNCGLFENCQSGGRCDSPLQLYSDSSCSSSCL